MYIICIHNSPPIKSSRKYSTNVPIMTRYFSEPNSYFPQDLRYDTSRNLFPSDFSSNNLYRVIISPLLGLLILLSLILSAQCVTKLTNFEVPHQVISRVTSFFTRQHVFSSKTNLYNSPSFFSLPSYFKFYARIEKTKKPILSQACQQQLEEYSFLINRKRMSVMQRSDEYKYWEKRTVNQAMLYLYLNGCY